MGESDSSTDSGFWSALSARFQRIHASLHRNPITGLFTKITVTVLGVLVIGAGLVMMVTPGPGIVGIIVGLSILGLEWHWAQRWVHAMKEKAQQAADRARDLDPAVRRRRLLLTVAGLVVIAAAVVGYVRTYDWPRWAVSGWDWVQGLSGFIPELPGM